MFTPSQLTGRLARTGLLLLIFSVFISTNQTQACDRTDFVLDSITTVGSEYEIHTTLHIGAGILGSMRGAASNTTSFGFGFFSCQSNFRISNFPSVLVSDVTKIPAYGISVGPGFFGTQGFVFYQAYGDYTCVTSTAYCGVVHTDTTHITFRTPVLPDSIRAYGLEGAGNPFAGCFPDADMVIHFGGMAFDCPSEAAPEEEDPMVLMPSSIRESIPPFLTYGYQPLSSEIAPSSEGHTTTHLAPTQEALELSIFPNPNQGIFQVRAEGIPVQGAALKIFNLTGQEMARQSVAPGSPEVTLQLDQLPAGLYLLRLETDSGSLTRRFQVRH